MSNKIVYYTEEGLKKLKDELYDLKTRGRKDMSAQIAEARDKGDLSENAEYDAAKDAQGHLEHRIVILEQAVGNARVLDESKMDFSKVSPLTKVTIKNKANGAIMSYTLVAENEANLKEGKISFESPIGKGLMGMKVGEVAKIKVPAGELEMEILEIGK